MSNFGGLKVTGDAAVDFSPAESPSVLGTYKVTAPGSAIWMLSETVTLTFGGDDYWYIVISGSPTFRGPPISAGPEGTYTPYSPQAAGDAVVKAVPIIELIADDIKDAVDAITVENGFNYDLTAVRTQRVTFSGVTVNDGKVLIWQGPTRRVGEPACGCQEWETSFYVEAVAVDAGDADSIDTLLNTVAADLEKKLKEDPTRGSLALDGQFDGVTKMYDEEFTSAAVEMTVHWRHQEDDPYSQI